MVGGACIVIKTTKCGVKGGSSGRTTVQFESRSGPGRLRSCEMGKLCMAGDICTCDDVGRKAKCCNRRRVFKDGSSFGLAVCGCSGAVRMSYCLTRKAGLLSR